MQSRSFLWLLCIAFFSNFSNIDAMEKGKKIKSRKLNDKETKAIWGILKMKDETSEGGGDVKRIILKPFICNWSDCKKRFTTNAGCNRHMKMHAREKKFKCENCAKEFVFVSSLIKHKSHSCNF